MALSRENLPFFMRRPIRVAVSVARDPVESFTTLRERLIERREQQKPRAIYAADPHWESRLQALIGAHFAASDTEEFWHLWYGVNERLRARGLQVGPQSFGAWNDGDAGLSRAAWYLTRHLRPRVVLETGVARGITTRFLLEALERNGQGHLWSIDLPPQLDPALHSQIGAAVLDDLKHRWSYVKGSSRRRLPPLLARIPEVDLFIHDSLHSARNVRFELDHVWRTLRPGGFVLVDDIDANSAFNSFLGDKIGHEALVCESEPVSPDLRRINGKGMFGIIRKVQAS